MQIRRTPKETFTTLLLLLMVVSLMLLGPAALHPVSAAAGGLAAPLANAWQQVAQAGQAVRSLAASPSDANIVYGAVDSPTNGGVYRSSDGGRTWGSIPLLANNGLSNREVQAVAVCPSGQVFAGTWGGGVYRADAISWVSVTGGINDLGYVTTLDCDTQGRLFAGTIDKGIFRSTTAGASWSAVNSGLINQSVLAIRSRGNRIFAGTLDGAFASVNGGDGWSMIGLQGYRIFDFEFDPTDAQRLWAASTGAGVQLSSDGGATWSRVGAILEAYSVARDADGKLYAGTRSAGAYRFIGGQWIRQELGAGRVYALRAFGSPVPRIVAGTGEGIWIPPLPQVHLSLRSDPSGAVSNGSELTYYIDYWGDGIGTISNVVITNAVPAGTSAVPDSIMPAGSGSVADGVVTWHLDTLDPDTDRGVLSYRVRACVAIATQVNPEGAGSIVLPPGCPGSDRYAPGVPIGVSAFTKPGYAFKAWTATAGSFGNADLLNTTFTPGNEDVIVTAHFDAAALVNRATAPSGSVPAEPIINYGAHARWQYAGIEYQTSSNSVINGKRLFLPLIVKSVG